MAIKALKQSISISEVQKMIHLWKKRGVNDPTITKLLDLYLGIPAYMDHQGIYPLCNFYDLRLSLRFSYTSTLITAVTNCRSFGVVWDETHTKIIAFYSPLWYRKEKENPGETPHDPAPKTPQNAAHDPAFYNNNILYHTDNYILRRIPAREVLPEKRQELRKGRLHLRLPPPTFSTGSTPPPKKSSGYWCRSSTA